jgi:hypothetical protein
MPPSVVALFCNRVWDLRTCVYRKLNPNVLMMKPAQDGVRNYGAGSLNRTRDRRILFAKTDAF